MVFLKLAHVDHTMYIRRIVSVVTLFPEINVDAISIHVSFEKRDSSTWW
jgi:hypothetical protein